MEILRKIFSRNRQDIGGPILPAEQFRAIVLHECARCDRNSHQFSLIHLLLGRGGNGNSEKIRQLTRAIIRRMRTTDEIGWLDTRSIGIFLPETNHEGARRLAEDVLKGCVYQIYTYPQNPIAHKEDRNGDGSRPRSSDASGAGMATKTPPARAPQPTVLHRHSKPSGKDAILSSVASAENRVEELLLPSRMPAWKRGLDLVGASILLVVLSPLLALVALYIKLVSPGPVFFRQERVGYLRRPFTIWKFRTMHAKSDNVTVHKDYLKDLIHKGEKAMAKLDAKGPDRRLIPLAGLFRRTCIDELPQLFNVVLGNMSLVGPRPCLAYEAEEFAQWQNRRFHTFPGLTGLWQVSGKNRLTFNQMMRLDIRYSQRKNLWMDLVISLKTVPAIIGQVMDQVVSRMGIKVPSMSRLSALRGRTFTSFVRQMFL